MTVVGIRLPGGRAIWAEISSRPPNPLDRVRVRLPDGDADGTVFVTSAQLLRPPGRVDGTITSIHEPLPPAPEGAIPGADMPPLGSSLDVEGAREIVTGLDMVRRLVQITLPDGEIVERSR